MDGLRVRRQGVAGFLLVVSVLLRNSKGYRSSDPRSRWLLRLWCLLRLWRWERGHHLDNIKTKTQKNSFPRSPRAFKWLIRKELGWGTGDQNAESQAFPPFPTKKNRAMFFGFCEAYIGSDKLWNLR